MQTRLVLEIDAVVGPRHAGWSQACRHADKQVGARHADKQVGARHADKQVGPRHAGMQTSRLDPDMQACRQAGWTQTCRHADKQARNLGREPDGAVGARRDSYRTSTKPDGEVRRITRSEGIL